MLKLLACLCLIIADLYGAPVQILNVCCWRILLKTNMQYRWMLKAGRLVNLAAFKYVKGVYILVTHIPDSFFEEWSYKCEAVLETLGLRDYKLCNILNSSRRG